MAVGVRSVGDVILGPLHAPSSPYLPICQDRVKTKQTFNSQSRTIAWSPPLLRWAGSKRKLLPILMAHTPSRFGRYIEPFAGSACLFLALRPDTAVLGDINCELLEAYSVVRSHPRKVARAALAWKSTEKAYYQVRQLDPEKLTPVERAARFIYLNRYCFNGVFRTNRKGQFNVPRGRRTGEFPTEAAFYRCAVALRNAELRSGDFQRCTEDIKKDDFVYLDPPYASTGRPQFGEYGYGCFNEDDISRLIECLERIDKKNATFLLSYSNTDSLRAQTGNWYCAELNVRRHVAGFAKHRRTVSEILISNRPLISN